MSSTALTADVLILTGNVTARMTVEITPMRGVVPPGTQHVNLTNGCALMVPVYRKHGKTQCIKSLPTLLHVPLKII